jgi:transcription termination factor NusB
MREADSFPRRMSFMRFLSRQRNSKYIEKSSKKSKKGSGDEEIKVTCMASRHLSRSIALQSLYEWDFRGRDESKFNEVVERNIKEFGPGLEDAAFVWQLVNWVHEKFE